MTPDARHEIVVLTCAGVVSMGLSVALVVSCVSTGETVSEAALEGGAGAAGAALGGPLWAGAASFFAHAWNAIADAGRETQAVVASLGPFARIGDWIDRSLRLALIVAAVLLVTFPRWRAVAWDLVSGIPRAVYAAVVRRDLPAAGEAAKDALLATPRLFGAIRESPRAREKSLRPKEEA